jgi:hypothetical protein
MAAETIKVQGYLTSVYVRQIPRPGEAVFSTGGGSKGGTTQGSRKNAVFVGRGAAAEAGEPDRLRKGELSEACCDEVCFAYFLK